MKKLFILFLLLITSFCTIIPSVSGSADPKILDPISGLLFGKNDHLSYVFFSEEQHVLIQNFSGGVNSYYKLLNGEVYRDNVITYKLDGWGSYDGDYIGLYMRETAQGTELGVTVQTSRNLAKNAAKALESSGGYQDVTLGKVLESPVLYTLSALSPVVKTSVAGIFKPGVNELISIEDLTLETPITLPNLVKSAKAANGTLTVKKFPLTFTTNISDSSTIYHYTSSANAISLVGIKFDFDGEFPRLHIIESPRGTLSLSAAIESMVLKLDNIIIWEYSFFSSLRVLDSSLELFFGNTFIEFDPAVVGTYKPLNTSLWFFNKIEDSIRITKRYGNSFIEEDYLIGPTLINGVFELIDFRNSNLPQTYSGKFFTITASAGTPSTDISTITIANTIDGFKNPILEKQIKHSTALAENDITFGPLQTIADPILGMIGSGVQPVDGRSGFQAYVDSQNDTIHLVGGWTNVGEFLSSIPKHESLSSAKLKEVYNPVWTITDIYGSTSPNTSFSKNLTVDGSVHFQQMVGATTKQSQTRTTDTFWAYGTGAIGNNKFSFNNINNNNDWNTSVLNKSFFNNKYHSAMVAHNNHLYILGGTFCNEISAPIVGSAVKYGTHKSAISMTPTSSAVTASSWREMQATSDWAARIHPRVFSIGKTMVLVGGMTGGNTTTAPAPVNDVWTSEDSGTNWTEVTTSGGIPKQASDNGGPLIGTAHNGIIYLLDENRKIYYSSDKGITWKTTTVDFSLSPSKKLYGAQLVAIKDELILIGGQTEPASISGGSPQMEENIYKLKISSMY